MHQRVVPFRIQTMTTQFFTSTNHSAPYIIGKKQTQVSELFLNKIYDSHISTNAAESIVKFEQLLTLATSTFLGCHAGIHGTPRHVQVEITKIHPTVLPVLDSVRSHIPGIVLLIHCIVTKCRKCRLQTCKQTRLYLAIISSLLIRSHPGHSKGSSLNSCISSFLSQLSSSSLRSNLTSSPG